MTVQQPCYIFISSHLAGAKALFPIPQKENSELCYSGTILDRIIRDKRWIGGGEERTETWVVALIPASVMWKGERDFPVGLKMVGFLVPILRSSHSKSFAFIH